jgi:hypothetical protein
MLKAVDTPGRFRLRPGAYPPACHFAPASPSIRRKSHAQQSPFAPRGLLRFFATTGPSATLSSSSGFGIRRSTFLRRFLAGMRRASSVARRTLATVLIRLPRRSVPPKPEEGGPCLRPRREGVGLQG